MLRSTFRHLQGIGPVRERQLWSEGILTWQDLRESLSSQMTLFRSSASLLRQELEESEQAIDRADFAWFSSRLPSADQFRIAVTAPSRTMFLDIETTGLSRYYDSITLVGWQLGDATHTLIDNDDPDLLFESMRQAAAIVTYNGILFDVPFLLRDYQSLAVPTCHIDLRFLGKRHGLVGGQKRIEVQLGLKRPADLEEIASAHAPILWHEYKYGSRESLARLIDYNRADLEGLRGILDYCAEKAVRELGLPTRTSLFRFADERERSTSKTRATSLPVFGGRSGPRITLEELALPEESRIVGIDLSGSEKRPTGWARLTGGHAATRLLRTDDEILRATLDARPRVVSIDAPLSLPRGRTSVDDSDPGRDRYGITREAEKVLRRRGVNVYPALIRSMQGLTRRGIALASELRRSGVAVIESYPGAAQDILDIPRRKASIEFLQRGLESFGVRGVSTDLSHDELDAITASIVGAFYLVGSFEAIGDPEENLMVLPSINGELGHERIAIGLSGPIATGKTTVGRWLEAQGFAYARYSQAIRQIATAQNAEPTADSLQRIGHSIYSTGQQAWLGRRVLDLLPDAAQVVIDGVRHPEDHAFLSEEFGLGFKHIHIRTPRSQRRVRFRMSRDRGDGFDTADAHPAEQNVHKLEGLADAILVNDGTIDDLHARTAAVLAALGIGGQACQ